MGRGGGVGGSSVGLRSEFKMGTAHQPGQGGELSESNEVQHLGGTESDLHYKLSSPRKFDDNYRK